MRTRRDRSSRRTAFACVLTVFVLAGPLVAVAAAQVKPAATKRPPSGPRFDVSIGGGFLSGSSLGDGAADLRTRGGQPFELFTTETRIAASVPIEGRLTFLLGSRYALEVRGAWARPEVRTSITDDVEDAAPQIVAERVSLYSLDAGLLVAFKPNRAGVVAPFLSGGAGYIGAVHEGLTLLENGVLYRGGGGFRYPIAMRTQGRLKGYGVRADAGLVMLTGGIADGTGATRQMTASGSLFLTF